MSVEEFHTKKVNKIFSWFAWAWASNKRIIFYFFRIFEILNARHTVVRGISPLRRARNDAATHGIRSAAQVYRGVRWKLIGSNVPWQRAGAGECRKARGRKGGWGSRSRVWVLINGSRQAEELPCDRMAWLGTGYVRSRKRF